MKTAPELNKPLGFSSPLWTAEAVVSGARPLSILTLEKGGAKIFDVFFTAENELEADIYFDAKKEPVRLVANVPAGDFSLSVVNSGHRAALYINSALEDEDWPLGRALLFGAACSSLFGEWSFSPGTAAEPAFEPRTIKTEIDGWRPEGRNTGVGDCMPFSHGGVFRLFYLFDRRGHKSKWGLGAHQWAQISSSDLENWTLQPMAIPIDEQFEGSICTGSLIHNGGLYYAFYAVRMCDGSPAMLSYSTSADCVKFKKSGNYFTLNSPYDPPSARDPKVFADSSGLFHMLVTTSVTRDGKKTGCLAHLTSADLLGWEENPPFIVCDGDDQPECPDYFFFGGRYYLVYSIKGIARYFYSASPFGPWEAPENNILVSSGCGVPKTAVFNSRLYAVGFTPDPGRGYAGSVRFSELFIGAAGELFTV